jgi:hypothetical protein
VPAAAVIPAPIAYIKVVAVKKLVVEFLANDMLAYVSILLVIRLRNHSGLHWSIGGEGTLP